MAEEFLDECIAVLSRTPATLDSLLRDLPDPWTTCTEGPQTWCPFDVVGHLIHAEKTDWMPRLRTILEHGTGRPFDPFDREAQFRESVGRTLPTLLDELTDLRRANIATLRSQDLTTAHFDLQGTHPALGTVTLRQLLATWTAHDLSHVVQIARTMARRYREDVGPFAQYLSVMK